jgi:uncharacterized membrane protein YhaH (DUF805 family)
MLEAYFTFDGRMRRLRLLIFAVLLIVLLAIVTVVGMLTIDLARSVVVAKLFFYCLMAVLWLCGWAAMCVKRLHDLDRSGWHYLWLILAPQALVLAAGTSEFSLRGGGFSFAWEGGLLSIIGLIWVLLGLFHLLSARGTDGPNRYGYPP